MSEFEYDRRFAQATAAGEQISSDLMQRLAWVAEKCGLTSGKVLEVLRAAAQAPGENGYRGMVLVPGEIGDRRTVLPVYNSDRSWYGGDYTEFKINTEGLEED